MDTNKKRLRKKRHFNPPIKSINDLLNTSLSHYIIFSLAIIGFITSLVIHIASYKGVVINNFWVLHFCVFIVWLPTISVVKNITSEKRKTFLEYINKNAPKWLRIIFIPITIYTLLIFLVYIFSLTGMETPGELVRKNNLNRAEILLRELTQGEFENSKTYEIRSFSSLWLFLYFSAIIIVYSKILARRKKKTLKRKEYTIKPTEFRTSRLDLN